MTTYHWNGEYWYRKTDSLLRRVAEWFVWGNWQWFPHPWPVALFGHRITFYGWGWRVRAGCGSLTYSNRPQRALYYSPNGTPAQATTWYMGTPCEVIQAADETRRQKDAARILREAALGGG